MLGKIQVKVCSECGDEFSGSHTTCFACYKAKKNAKLRENNIIKHNQIQAEKSRLRRANKTPMTAGMKASSQKFSLPETNLT